MEYKSASFTLTYLPLLIRLQCCEPAKLPAYLGSMLHGVMGWALMSHPKAYQVIFENRRYGQGKQDIVNPYLIKTPSSQMLYERGDWLCFEFTLLGHAADFVEEVVEALVDKGVFKLGAERKTFKLVDILQAERLQAIWQQGQLYKYAAVLETLTERDPCGPFTNCSVQLLTPLRIRRGGQLLKTIDFATIIRSITRRVSAVTERYGGKSALEALAHICEQATAIKMNSCGLYVMELQRYSNRRQTKMDMSGLLGAMTFEGELAAYASFLEAAQVLHIGRNTTFGFGQIKVVLS